MLALLRNALVLFDPILLILGGDWKQEDECLDRLRHHRE